MVNDRFPTMDTWAGALLIAVALLVMAAQVMSPLVHRVEGRPLRQLRVPFSAKVRRQRLPLALLGVVIGVQLISGHVELGLHLGAIVIAAILLAAPARYVMTDRGIRAGWTPFRRWTEFAGLSVRRGTIRLQPLSGLAKLEIVLPGRFEDADIVGEMRALIRASYQGGRPEDGAAESGEGPGGASLKLAEELC